MTKAEMQKLMDAIFKRCQGTREAGQKEYAHNEEEAFSNFFRVGQYLNIDKKKVLLTYMIKHMDGVTSYVNGHKSQREDVRGRIQDMIVYLCLLWGMINEEEEMPASFVDYEIRTSDKIGMMQRRDPNNPIVNRSGDLTQFNRPASSISRT